MNIRIFNELIKNRPSQNPPEWKMLFEICDLYLKRRRIKNPVVVELGVWKGRQKIFWEQLLKAEHIGIDISEKRDLADIRGDTNDPKTVKKLKEILKRRSINILFIDASHEYEKVKKDFELYSPLCSDIVVFHDVECRRYKKKRSVGEVYELWDELKEAAHRGEEKYRDFLFLTIYQKRSGRNQMGIGMIIKK